MRIITLFQTGIVKHLREPPPPRSDTDKVNASAEAFSRFDTPDAVLGVGNLVHRPL